MSAYEALAASYDSLTRDVDYQAIADFYQALLEQAGVRPSVVLDLACGTGSLSVELARRGYTVIGADRSEDMLTQAYDKAADCPGIRPFFICQAMEELELPEPVDWTVSCLDAVNYLTEAGAVQETFRRVYENLNPGGVFTFDVNTPEKLRAMDGQIFLDENDDTYCVWRAEFDETENICYYGMDLFQRRGRRWDRSFEEHAEYAWTAQQLTQMLEQAGFQNIQIYGAWRLEPPADGEQRLIFFAGRGA